MTGEVRANTTFYRKNLNTGNYETAGSIEWTAEWNAKVTFGIDDVGSQAGVGTRGRLNLHFNSLGSP